MGGGRCRGVFAGWASPAPGPSPQGRGGKARHQFVALGQIADRIAFRAQALCNCGHARRGVETDCVALRTGTRGIVRQDQRDAPFFTRHAAQPCPARREIGRGDDAFGFAAMHDPRIFPRIVDRRLGLERNERPTDAAVHFRQHHVHGQIGGAESARRRQPRLARRQRERNLQHRRIGAIEHGGVFAARGEGSGVDDDVRRKSRDRRGDDIRRGAILQTCDEYRLHREIADDKRVGKRLERRNVGGQPVRAVEDDQRARRASARGAAEGFGATGGRRRLRLAPGERPADARRNEREQRNEIVRTRLPARTHGCAGGRRAAESRRDRGAHPRDGRRGRWRAQCFSRGTAPRFRRFRSASNLRRRDSGSARISRGPRSFRDRDRSNRGVSIEPAKRAAGSASPPHGARGRPPRRRGRNRKKRDRRTRPAIARGRQRNPARRSSPYRGREGACQARNMASTPARSMPFSPMTTSREARASPGVQARSNSWRTRWPTPCTSRRIGLPATETIALRAQHVVRRGGSRTDALRKPQRPRYRRDRREGLEIVVVVALLRIVMRGALREIVFGRRMQAEQNGRLDPPFARQNRFRPGRRAARSRAMTFAALAASRRSALFSTTRSAQRNWSS